MRLFAATLATETWTFSPMASTLEDYRKGVFLRPGEHPRDAPRMCTAPLFVARRAAESGAFTLVEGSCFAASPSGTTNRSAYEEMRDEILAQCRAAMPLDGVLLGLHGAMVAQGCDDVEGDLLQRLRHVVGPGCVIGVEFDLHCHLTSKKVRCSNLVVLYKEFPHTDVVERAEELLNLVLRTISGQIRPVMSLFDCRQISSYPTTLPLMRAFVDKVKTMEGREKVLSISINHGFPYADVADLGSSILVVADHDKARADAVAASVGQEFVSMRGRTLPAALSVEEGISAALDSGGGPVVIADPADNAGGGAPSDNTTILRRLIERDVEGACLGPLWDPVAVKLCFAAGEGAEFDLRFGGKTARTSGLPVDARVRVTGLKRDCWQSFGPTMEPIGDCAAVRVGGIDVVLVSTRNQALGLELFRNVGVEPTERRLVVVKSTNHFMAAYGPVARRVIYVDSDGPLCRDLRRIPYTRVRRPIWPLDERTEPGLVL